MNGPQDPSPPPAPEGGGAGASPRATGDGLRTAALRGGLFTLVAFGGGQFLRLLSNLLLTRLLFPEAFGLMALVNGCMAALQMFSDLGIRANIIHDRDGESERFLHTAWTLGVIRNTVIWLVACGLSWPLARLYEQPQLLELLPVVALQAFILGFSSTAGSILNRNLMLGRITAVELFSQAASLAAMCAVAWAWRSVWALVVGNLVSALLRMVLSHTVLPGIRPRFAWDREMARRMIRFGRWIFLSSMLTYLASRSDRLILGASMTIASLGVYNIAAFLAQAVQEGLSSIASRVLFPLYARLNEVEPEALRPRIRKIRGLLLLLALPPVCGLVVFGPDVLALLYDHRYQGGDWMLQALAAGSLVECVGLTATPVLLARGDSLRHMLVLAVRSALLVAGVALGNRYAGIPGQVVAIALNATLGYPALAWAVRAHGVWMPGLDALSLLASAGVIGLLTALRGLLAP